jgi:hypothetical protein
MLHLTNGRDFTARPIGTAVGNRFYKNPQSIAIAIPMGSECGYAVPGFVKED